MNILRMVKTHIKIHGWPVEPIRLGPAPCGQAKNGFKAECRIDHAYAEAVGRTSMFDDTVYAFVYDRPCNVHEAAWGLDKRKKEGISARG